MSLFLHIRHTLILWHWRLWTLKPRETDESGNWVRIRSRGYDDIKKRTNSRSNFSETLALSSNLDFESSLLFFTYYAAIQVVYRASVAPCQWGHSCWPAVQMCKAIFLFSSEVNSDKPWRVLTNTRLGTHWTLLAFRFRMVIFEWDRLRTSDQDNPTRFCLLPKCAKLRQIRLWWLA